MYKLSSIPNKPGIYQFLDSKKNLLYIGKAKNLKNRVRSYFTNNANLSPSKQQMVKAIKHIKYTIVNNETEALLLEKTLIRKHQPPFNIDLKDDKYFLYIKIDLNERYPQIQTTRNFIPHNKIKYFGPYTSSANVHKIIKLAKKIIASQIGWENYWQYQTNLEKINISSNKYQKIIKQIIKLLSGNNKEILQNLIMKMNLASQEKNYELAAIYRDYIAAIKSLDIKQRMVFNKNINEDYLSIYTQNASAIINLFKVRNGKLIEQNNFIIKHKSQLDTIDILSEFCEQYYNKTTDLPRAIITNIKINTLIKNIVPRQEDKLKLLKLGLVNAKDYATKQLRSWEKDGTKIAKTLKQLAKGLGVKNKLNRIEIYDISNIQGMYAVGSMVVFTRGQADKKQYRKFKIKTVTGPDDHHMMQEVVARRLAHQDWPSPDLIILDGGKPQLSTVLQLPNIDKKKIVALAKKEENIYMPNKEIIKFKPSSEEYFLLQRMRDEAHRFTISFYRSKHAKSNIASQLDNRPGVGPKTKKLLKNKYGSWHNIKTAPNSELAKLIGKKRTNIVKNS